MNNQLKKHSILKVMVLLIILSVFPFIYAQKRNLDSNPFLIYFIALSYVITPILCINPNPVTNYI